MTKKFPILQTIIVLINLAITIDQPDPIYFKIKIAPDLNVLCSFNKEQI